jgi:methylmalonyl-CoA/ethylmalonyl-CoA epimerase
MGRKLKLRLHHIGLVVPHLSELVEVFRSLGLKQATQPESDPIQKVTASFIASDKGEGTYIELVEPLSDDSPVTNFLKGTGGGLHHLCFKVDDIDSVVDELVEKGFKLVSPPVECAGYDRSFRPGSTQPSKITFFLLDNKVLIELLQEGKE